MGGVYYSVEILWDGSSHWSMFILGGVCGVLIGLLNEHYLTWDMPIWKQVLYGECIVLPLEFVTGLIVNVWLGLNVWDYSHIPLNIMGQTSLPFAIVFIPVILLAIFMDDFYRWLFLHEQKPKYSL